METINQARPKYKFATCPSCGKMHGLNPFHFGVVSRTVNQITSRKVTHHKCKKCLWQGYVMVNSESRGLNRMMTLLVYGLTGLLISISVGFLLVKFI